MKKLINLFLFIGTLILSTACGEATNAPEDTQPYKCNGVHKGVADSVTHTVQQLCTSDVSKYTPVTINRNGTIEKHAGICVYDLASANDFARRIHTSAGGS